MANDTPLPNMADFLRQPQDKLPNMAAFLRGEPEKPTATATDSSAAVRTFKRAGATAGLRVNQVLDFIGLNPYEYGTDYWKQKELENPRDTGGVMDAWERNEFDTWLMESVGDTIGNLLPAAAGALLAAYGGAGLMGRAALRAGPLTPTMLATARNTGAKWGASLGMFGVSAVGQGNDTADMLREEGLTPTALNVAPAAIVKGGLDAFGMGKMAGVLGLGRLFGSKVTGELEKRGLATILRDEGFASALRTGGAAALKVAGVEGITEATQEAIDVGLVAALKDESLWKAYPREMTRILDAGLGGAILGGVLGGAGRVMPQAEGFVIPKEDRDIQIDALEKVLEQRRIASKEAEQKLKEMNTYGLGATVTDLTGLGDIPEFGTDFTPNPLAGAGGSPLTDSAALAQQSLMQQEHAQAVAATGVNPQAVMAEIDPWESYANYTPYDVGQGVRQQEVAAQFGASMKGILTENARGDIYETVATPTGLTTKVMLADSGRERKLFDSTFGVQGERLVVTMGKVSNASPDSIMSFVKSTIEAGKQAGGLELQVWMPPGTKNVWKDFAAAHGAVVEKNSFRIPLQPGQLLSGQQIVARDTIISSGVALHVRNSADVARAVVAAETTLETPASNVLFAGETIRPELPEDVDTTTLGPENEFVQATAIDPNDARTLLSAYKRVAKEINGVDMWALPGTRRALAQLIDTRGGPGRMLTVVSPAIEENPRMTAHLADLQKTVSKWREDFLPDDNVVFVAAWNQQSFEQGHQMAFQTTDDGQITHVITVNLGSDIRTQLGKPAEVVAFRNTYIAAHEFGHAVHSSMWYKAPLELRQKILTEFENRRQDMRNKSLREWMAGLSPMGNLARFENLDPAINAPGKWQDLPDGKRTFGQYLSSDIEQMADQFANILMAEYRSPASPFRAYLARWIQTISGFARALRLTKSAGGPGVRQFYNWLLAKNQKEQVRKINSGPKVPPRRMASDAAIRNMQEIPVSEDTALQIRQHADLDIRGFNFLKHVLNMPQLVDRFRVPALEQYWTTIKRMKVLKDEIIVKADELAKQYYGMGRQERATVTEFLYWLNDTSEAEGKRFTNEEIVKLALGKLEGFTPPVKLSEKQTAYVMDLQANFFDVLKKMEHSQKIEAAFGVFPDGQVDAFVQAWNAATDAAQRDAVFVQFTGHGIEDHPNASVAQLYATLTGIEGKIAALGNRNYVPKMRHGKYTMRMRATKDLVYDGVEYKEGQTMFFMAFDSETEQKREVKNFANKFRGQDVLITADVMSEAQFSVAGLPRAFIDAIKNNEALKLSPQQKADLEVMALEYSPSRSFTKHLLRRDNILGYSKDFGRTYSNYMFRAAGHISKTQYGRQATQAIQAFSREKDTKLSAGVVDNSAWTDMQNFVQDHYSHIMSPDTDWSRVRSFMSAWYLGFMPRSAIANLYQVPMATVPYLSARYGDIKAWEAVTKSYFITKKQLESGKLPAELDVGLQRAMKEGYIDASAIVELGAIGDSNIIDRMTGIDTQRLWAKWVIDRGFMMFRGAEKLNRRVTFLSAFQLEWERSKDADKAYAEAVKAIELTQFDMSKEARAKVFRGGKGVLLMFNQHLFMMTYLAFGGLSMSKAHWAAGVRVMAMSAVLAGAEGLPWAGLGLDMFDALAQLYKKLRGEEYTYSDARADIREMAEALDVEPDLFMHGLTRQYGLGPLSILSLFGMPKIDLSGSVNLGYPGSWAQMLKSTEGTTEERWARMTESLGGPAYSILHGFWSAIADNNPNSWKQTERAMPAFARALSQGARWVEQGGETTSNGAIVYPVGEENLIDAAYRAAGLTPTKLAQNYEQHGMMAEAAAYWHGRKRTLLAEYAFARQRGDSDEIRQAKANIAAYNRVVAKMAVGKSFKITQRNLAISFKSREAARRRIEQGKAANAAHQALMDQYSAYFGDQTGTVAGGGTGVAW